MRAMGFAYTERRYTSGSTSKDLFYYLVGTAFPTYFWSGADSHSQCNEDSAEKVDPPKPVVISDGVLALIAGSDTTSSVLASTFWCLMRHPEAYKRLQVEVDKFYPPGENSLDPKHLPNMPYLEAVM